MGKYAREKRKIELNKLSEGKVNLMSMHREFLIEYHDLVVVNFEKNTVKPGMLALFTNGALVLRTDRKKKFVYHKHIEYEPLSFVISMGSKKSFQNMLKISNSKKQVTLITKDQKPKYRDEIVAKINNDMKELRIHMRKKKELLRNSKALE